MDPVEDVPIRCQRCQRGGFNKLDFCAACLRSLCLQCFADGCCTHKPALSGHHYDRQGMPKPVVRDDRDDDTDEWIESPILGGESG